jgi:hypothetical protein
MHAVECLKHMTGGRGGPHAGGETGISDDGREWGGGVGAAHERVRMAMTTAAPLRVTQLKINV